jgi:hypothetical protein
VKLYVRAPRPQFLPRAEDLIERVVRDIPAAVQFVHPLTGKLISMKRKGRSASEAEVNKLAAQKTESSNSPKKKGKSQ